MLPSRVRITITVDGADGEHDVKLQSQARIMRQEPLNYSPATL
jgi:hypothetical protein